MTEFQEVLVRNLKRYRAEAGLTQATLAERSGLSTGYIAEIESGRKYPSLETVEMFSEVLEVRPFRLFMSDEDATAFVRSGLAYLIAPEGPDAFVADVTETIRRRLFPED